MRTRVSSLRQRASNFRIIYFIQIFRIVRSFKVQICQTGVFV